MAAPAVAPRTGRRRARGPAALALVVVASLLVPIALVAVWARETLLDTDTFVDTAGAVARDPAVQREVSERVSTALTRQLDVERRAGSLLPDVVQSLAGPLSTGADAAIRRATREVVASSRFQDLWEVAVRAAHENALDIATGRPIAGVETRSGRVAVNLDPVVDAVVAQLPGPIAALVPPVTTNDDIVLFRSDELASAQGAVRAFEDWWWAAPLVCIALFAAAILVAPRRRIGVLAAGSGLALASASTGVVLLVGRERYLDGLDAESSRVIAGAVFDAVLGLLRAELWMGFGVGVALAAGAIIVGLLHHPPAVEPVVEPTVEPVLEEPTGRPADEPPGAPVPEPTGAPVPRVEPAAAERDAPPVPGPPARHSSTPRTSR